MTIDRYKNYVVRGWYNTKEGTVESYDLASPLCFRCSRFAVYADDTDGKQMWIADCTSKEIALAIASLCNMFVNTKD